VLAHRGLRSAGPESSLASIVAAFRACDGAEVDVLVTADGVPVVRHDERIEDGAAVRSLRLDDLRAAVRADADALPRVADVLAALSGAKGLLDLELKVPGAARALSALRPLPGFVATTSFYAAEVLDSSRLLPETRTGLLVSRAPPAFVPQAASCLAVHHALLDAVRSAHPWAAIWAWTVNDADAIAAARRARGEVVISDDPARIAALLVGS
jgi:glycerophosphoryl diester phosphodiesterase